MPAKEEKRQYGFNTRQLHAGQVPDPTTHSRAVPIYQTTSYQFKDTDHAARLFALQESGNIYTFPRRGIDVTLVDPREPENFRRAIRPNTKLIFGETLGNPLINVFPFDEVSKIAKEFGLPLVIDKT